MEKINVPGFTADIAIYFNNNQWRSFSILAHNEATIYPTLLDKDCYDTCLDECMAGCDSPSVTPDG
jgi:hypothetical protein